MVSLDSGPFVFVTEFRGCSPRSGRRSRDNALRISAPQDAVAPFQTGAAIPATRRPTTGAGAGESQMEALTAHIRLVFGRFALRSPEAQCRWALRRARRSPRDRAS